MKKVLKVILICSFALTLCFCVGQISSNTTTPVLAATYKQGSTGSTVKTI